MKNSEIHKGLDKKEIRDFLSQTLVKLMEEQFDNTQFMDVVKFLRRQM